MKNSLTESSRSPETRAGYVALVGRPNVGKSMLLNALTGERLSIVTPRAQTTREPVLGIYTDERTQIVFVDTPGLLEPRYLLHRSMLDAALTALDDADLSLLVLDSTRPEETLPDDAVVALLRQRATRLFVVVNKIDAALPGALDLLDAWSREHFDIAVQAVSALSGDGIEELRAALVGSLPLSPFFYPADEVAVQPVRFFVSELIRETIFEDFHEEVPYSTAVRIEEFRESREPVYIRAVIFVERESQKAILIGRQGAGLKGLGQRARQKIEAFLGQRIYLDLWVKAMPGWRKKASSLRHLGYPLPRGEEEPRPPQGSKSGGRASRRRRRT